MKEKKIFVIHLYEEQLIKLEALCKAYGLQKGPMVRVLITHAEIPKKEEKKEK